MNITSFEPLDCFLRENIPATNLIYHSILIQIENFLTVPILSYRGIPGEQTKRMNSRDELPGKFPRNGEQKRGISREFMRYEAQQMEL